MISISIKQALLRLSIAAFALLTITTCVYFNTFYNAKLFFSEAEKLRTENESESLGNKIIDNYKKVIEKTDIIIIKYPDSKYIEESLFLKGRAHYYLQEYALSESIFNTLLVTNPNDYQILVEYWLALNKWKSNKPQPAINDLELITSKINEKSLLAQIYQSQAEIYLELKQDSMAVLVLEKAAELTRNRKDKGQIYYRLAELAYENKNYNDAIIYYKNVIKYSYSNERVMEANLNIVKRYRDLNDLKKASKEIQSMLNDPEYSTIHDGLELELAKLYLTQKKREDAISILEDIVVKYPNTLTAAESFYLLGEHSLTEKRDFEKADFYFKQIQREASKSIFNKQGMQRIDEINKYKKSRDYVKDYDQISSKSDTLNSEYKNFLIDTTKVILELYNLGELEAFHFNKIDTAIIYFNRIINDFSESDLTTKTIFTLSHLFEQIGDTTIATDYKERIIKNYPDSEYADNIRLNNKFNGFGDSGFKLLSNIEKLYSTNSDSALIKYKNIASLSNSETSKRALLFVANEYDYKLFELDSAYKYYNQISIRFPESEQSKIAQDRLNYIKIDKMDSLGTTIK